MEAFTRINSTMSISSNSKDVRQSLKSRWRVVAARYRKTKKCITSMSVLMVFLWTFLVSLSYHIISNLGTYVIPLNMNVQYIEIGAASFPAILYFFYPIAGILADLKFSRYRTIIASLWMIVAGTLPALIGAGVLAGTLELEISKISRFALASFGVILMFFGLLLLACSAVGFNANVIQFGLDQLHDSASEDHVVFIQWYLWIYFLAIFAVNLWNQLQQLQLNYLNSYFYTIASIFATLSIITIISLYFSNRNSHWFLINPRVASNPYKLVLQVSKFAYQHKFPVNRSAFTYSDDEIPSRLDFAKRKYGGPFTVEEVEDVKVFYEITKLLFCTGAFFFLDIAAKPMSYVFKMHILRKLYYDYFHDPVTLSNRVAFYFIDGSLLYGAEIVFIYPIYIFLVRPFISYYIPGSFVRMGFGLSVLIISLLTFLGMDIFAHAQDKGTMCMFSTSVEVIKQNNNSQIVTSLSSSKTIYAIVTFQVAIAMLINVAFLSAVYEFIFAQSPQAMKGLFMGMCFAVQGIFRALGSLVLLLFVMYGPLITLPSCGTVYYALNVIIGIVSLLVFVYQARKYKYRKRDECCNYYYYAEEYISKVIEEDESRSINKT